MTRRWKKKPTYLPSCAKRRRRMLHVHASVHRISESKVAAHSLDRRVHASEPHPVFTNHPRKENIPSHRRRHSMLLDPWSFCEHERTM